MRAAMAAAAAACLAAAAGGTANAAAERTTIREVDFSKFPTISATVALPEAFDPERDSLTVAEDGAVVTDFELESLFDSGEDVDVVLAIDTSGSMLGEPIARAKAAAGSFVRDVPEGVGVGVLAFANRPRVVAPISDDHERALREIAALTAGGETSLFDGVVRAAGMFEGAAQHNIVLLSDGGDTVSSGNLTQAARRASDAGVAVFAVGLRSPETDIVSLRRLASQSGGRYAPADSADLSTIYQDLAAEIGTQYVVSYESASPGGGEIELTVEALGTGDSSLFLVPEAEAPKTVPRPRIVEPADPLIEGSAGLGVALALTFVAAFVVAQMAFGATARTMRERKLAKVVSGTGERRQIEDDPSAAQWIPRSLVAFSEQAATAAGVSTGLGATLERADVSLRPGEFIAVSLLAGAAGGLVGLMLGSPLLALLLGIVAVIGPYTWAKMFERRRIAKIHEQLPDILMVLASSLRAGHSFFQALNAVAREVRDPGASEFSRVVAEIRLGRPIEDAMNELAERVQSEDFKWAVLAVNIHREVGGNLAEVLDTVSQTMRERHTIRRQVQVLSAEGRISIFILCALPFGLAIYMAFVNRPYLSLLWTTRIGLVMLIGSIALMTLGVMWMRRVVKIDV